jgi:hypothetical protein
LHVNGLAWVWLAIQSSLLALSTNLLADLFFDLFKCLEEKLLHIATLIQDHLTECLDLSQLRVLRAHYLSKVDNLLLLITDDLLVLIPDQLLLLLEVLNDLPKRLFKNLNLAF